MTYLIIGSVFILAILFLCYYLYKTNATLKTKNKELEALHTEAESQSNNYKDFIYSLSSELRTPLYGMMGLTNIIAEEHPDLTNDPNLKSLKFSGNYLLNLINNVLQINYLDSKEILIDKQVFHLEELTANIVNSFSYATKNSNNKLELQYDQEIDEFLIGDPAILSQIIINLINNALRFTRNGTIYFNVNLIKVENDMDRIAFSVKFDGKAISEEEGNVIYREFIDIKGKQKNYLGTGINSTIVKRLADALEGEVVIHDNTQQESEYTFVANFERTNKNTDLKPLADEKYKALIVDDNKLNLLVADKILSKMGFECTTVDNGFEAIDLTKENTFDIILMDINMPKLNGIGTTKRIREYDPNTPIIALTAVDVTQLNRQIIRAGFNDYILKPYDEILLKDLVNKYVTINSKVL